MLVMRDSGISQGLDQHRFPADVIEDLKRVAPLLGFSGYQPLVRAYVGQGLRMAVVRCHSSIRLGLNPCGAPRRQATHVPCERMFVLFPASWGSVA
jgi:hypothetical protein